MATLVPTAPTAIEPEALLRAVGFAPQEAARLVALRRRYERGAFREIPIGHKRLAFARWLVEHGRLSEQLDQAHVLEDLGGQR